MTVRIPIFNVGQRIVNDDGQPTLDFLTAFNSAITTLAKQTNINSDLLQQIQDALAQAGIAIGNAEAATAAANAVVNDQSLINSYVSPEAVLSAALDGTTATITIASHNRVYGNGTTVAVSGGALSGLDLSTIYYIFYNDLGRVGGTVAYEATTVPTDAAQGSAKHCVGSIQTPAEGATDPVPGVGTRPPGVPYLYRSLETDL